MDFDALRVARRVNRVEDVLLEVREVRFAEVDADVHARFLAAAQIALHRDGVVGGLALADGFVAAQREGDVVVVDVGLLRLVVGVDRDVLAGILEDHREALRALDAMIVGGRHAEGEARIRGAVEGQFDKVVADVFDVNARASPASRIDR